jgi:hypothetical protein
MVWQWLQIFNEMGRIKKYGILPDLAVNVEPL